MDIKRLHEENNFSPRKLAKYVGVSHMTVYNWMNGKSEPRLSQAEKIKEFLRA